jgi:hypothetical protein
MPAIDEWFGAPEKLPPFWGNSYWWTRAGGLLGLASLIAGVAMASLVAIHLGSCGLRHQLTNPTLAIEVAGSWQDVLAMVGPCEAAHCGQSVDENSCFAAGACQTICPDKVEALVFEQFLDFGFIVIYSLFFFYLGVMNWKYCYWVRYPLLTKITGRICGGATIVAGALGAAADWRENNHILQALSELHVMSGPVPLMRYFAYIKWRLLFLAIGVASPVFLFWPGKNDQADLRQSAFSHLLARVTAVLALSTAWTGVAACIYGDGHRLEVATKRLDLVIMAAMFTLATAQYWRGGTLAALNRLAKLPVLSFFATLFLSEGDPPQTSDTDPNRY